MHLLIFVHAFNLGWTECSWERGWLHAVNPWAEVAVRWHQRRVYQQQQQACLCLHRSGTSSYVYVSYVQSSLFQQRFPHIDNVTTALSIIHIVLHHRTMWWSSSFFGCHAAYTRVYMPYFHTVLFCYCRMKPASQCSRGSLTCCLLTASSTLLSGKDTNVYGYICVYANRCR